MVNCHQPIGRYHACIIDNIGKISLLSPAVYGQTTSCLIVPVAKTGEQVGWTTAFATRATCRQSTVNKVDVLRAQSKNNFARWNRPSNSPREKQWVITYEYKFLFLFFKGMTIWVPSQASTPLLQLQIDQETQFRIHPGFCSQGLCKSHGGTTVLTNQL